MGWLKVVHISTVIITISLFVIRGLGLFMNAGFMRQKWVKIVPHVNDTLLLATGIWMAVLIQQYPLVHGWLTAKLIALLVYIGLGLMVFRFARTRRERMAYWLVAILVFAYMVSVALYHHPLGWLVTL